MRRTKKRSRKTTPMVIPAEAKDLPVILASSGPKADLWLAAGRVT
jgi:hypothetical protein